jgi:hypothetical protein
MDREVLVKQMRRLERELRRQHGPVALFMLVPIESWGDAWRLVVSTKGFNRLGRAESIRQLIDLLRRVADREVWSHVPFVEVLRTDDRFVAAMTAWHPTQSVVDLHALEIQGFEIPKAVLFPAKKVAA